MFSIKDNNNELKTLSTLKINSSIIDTDFRSMTKFSNLDFKYVGDSIFEGIAFIPVEKWYVATLNFTSKEVKKVQISYQFLPTFTSTKHTMNFGEYFNIFKFKYNFKPAETWKGGKIENFALNIYYDDSQFQLSPVIKNRRDNSHIKFNKDINHYHFKTTNFDPSVLNDMNITYKYTDKSKLIYNVFFNYRNLLTPKSYDFSGFYFNEIFVEKESTLNKFDSYKHRYSTRSIDSLKVFKPGYNYVSYKKVPKSKDEYLNIDTITATSERLNYPVTNLHDGNYSSAWIEGEKDDGIGSKIRFEFDHFFILDYIYLVNGYQKSLKAYNENGVVKTIKVETSSGCRYIVDLPKQSNKILFNQRFNRDNSFVPTVISYQNQDCGKIDVYHYYVATPSSSQISLSKNDQQMPRNHQPINWIELEIMDVYPGSKSKGAAISDILIVPALDYDFYYEKAGIY